MIFACHGGFTRGRLGFMVTPGAGNVELGRLQALLDSGSARRLVRDAFFQRLSAAERLAGGNRTLSLAKGNLSILTTHDGADGRPAGVTDAVLHRAFAASGEGGAFTFEAPVHALVPARAQEAPWPVAPGWVLYHVYPAAKIGEQSGLDRLALRWILLEDKRVPLWEAVGVYLDTAYRLGADGEIDWDRLLTTHDPRHYRLGAKVRARAAALRAELAKIDAATEAACPDASAQSLKDTLKPRARLEHLLARERGGNGRGNGKTHPPAGATSVHRLINDRPAEANGGIGWAAWLEGQGVNDLAGVEDTTSFSSGHRVQIEAARSGQLAWAEGGQDALARWLPKPGDYPLHFLDFETFGSLLPLWPGCAVNEALPFQFSLHTVPAPGAAAVHDEWLHGEASDPRASFVEALRRAIPASTVGSLVVYTAYEAAVLKSLLASLRAGGAAYADAAAGLQEWMDHFLPESGPACVFDLHEPFCRGYPKTGGFEAWLHHPDQAGSTSIKHVHRALLGRDAYDGLPVADGAAASEAYVQATFFPESPEKTNETRRYLLRYCETDTLTMVEVMGVLLREH